MSQVKSTPKMSGLQRRDAIIRAVRQVFAEKGSHGSTTRELAQAAGVSEALLFKHFPNKEALYTAMIQACIQEKDQGFFERLMAMEPSTETLVIFVHLMVSHFVGGPKPSDGDEAIRVRLLQRSMMEDGEYARLLHQRLAAPFIQKIERSIDAAVAAGDAVAGPVPSNIKAWLAQHLGVTVMFNLLPETPIIDYGLSRGELVERIAWFALRGIGLTDEAIRQYYNSAALAPVAGAMKQCFAAEAANGRDCGVEST